MCWLLLENSYECKGDLLMSEIHRMCRSKRERILRNNGRLCVYCSNPATTVDHVLPLALCKWVGAPVEALDTESNCVASCSKCNIAKSAEIDLDKISELGDAHIARYHKMEPYIEKYESLIEGIIKKQKFKCYRCGSPINRHTCNIRRIDNRKARLMSNACLLCPGCNIHNFRRRDRAGCRGPLL